MGISRTIIYSKSWIAWNIINNQFLVIGEGPLPGFRLTNIKGILIHENTYLQILLKYLFEKTYSINKQEFNLK
jgi:hypothetical protein